VKKPPEFQTQGPQKKTIKKGAPGKFVFSTKKMRLLQREKGGRGDRGRQKRKKKENEDEKEKVLRTNKPEVRDSYHSKIPRR